uniref:Uncharacterized protein n=2 Tax=Plectus sambesii TaxID=2011161 RepID=A0A914V0Y0_9BILA
MPLRDVSLFCFSPGHVPPPRAGVARRRLLPPEYVGEFGVFRQGDGKWRNSLHLSLPPPPLSLFLSLPLVWPALVPLPTGRRRSAMGLRKGAPPRSAQIDAAVVMSAPIRRRRAVLLLWPLPTRGGRRPCCYLLGLKRFVHPGVVVGRRWGPPAAFVRRRSGVGAEEASTERAPRPLPQPINRGRRAETVTNTPVRSFFLSRSLVLSLASSPRHRAATTPSNHPSSSPTDRSFFLLCAAGPRRCPGPLGFGGAAAGCAGDLRSGCDACALPSMLRCHTQCHITASFDVLERGLGAAATVAVKYRSGKWAVFLCSASRNPVEVQLASLEEMMAIAIASLLCKIVTSSAVSLDWAYNVFLGKFTSFLQDPVFHIRKVCASSLGDISRMFGRELTEQVVVPHLLTLSQDSVWGVRKACAEVYTDVSNNCSMTIRRNHLAPKFIMLLADPSRWVSSQAFQTLGPFIATFANSNRTGLDFRDGTLTYHEPSNSEDE